MNIQEFILKVHNSPAPISEFIEQIPNNSFSYSAELINEIKIATENKDEDLLEDLLNIAGRDGLDKRYTNILSLLLNESWHHSQEDIAMMLEEIKDPASISKLYQRAINFLNHDDGRSLSKKCIWALGAIGTTEAKEKLILLKNQNDPIVSEVATMEIRGKFAS